jgi:ATP-dependent protease ClpP protease subunit
MAMNDRAILAKLAQLEKRIDELSAGAPLAYEPTGLAPAPWMLDLQRAHAFAGDTQEDATIEIIGEIDRHQRERVEDELWQKRAARDLTIIVDSEGGDFYHALAIFRAISFAPAETKTARLLGSCCSGAAIVAMAADKRIARPDTKLLIHMVGGDPSTTPRWTAAELRASANRLDALDRQWLSMMAERTGAPFDVLCQEAATEEYSSLDWCLANGIVHEVMP